MHGSGLLKYLKISGFNPRRSLTFAVAMGAKGTGLNHKSHTLQTQVFPNFLQITSHFSASPLHSQLPVSTFPLPRTMKYNSTLPSPQPWAGRENSSEWCSSSSEWSCHETQRAVCPR